MKKVKKENLVKMLKQQLHAAEVKFDETPGNAVWCYGYLIGTIKQTIGELEN